MEWAAREGGALAESMRFTSGKRRTVPAVEIDLVLFARDSPFDVHDINGRFCRMDSFSLQRLSPPGVTLLVAFLAFTSQWLFRSLEPGPLRKGDALLFNILVTCLLICYWRTCFTDPGRIPKDWKDQLESPRPSDGTSTSADASPQSNPQSNRWCRRCDALKPPRAHHCKTCGRCIVKMDHHCVWTANCVSHVTIPHFIRFLVYAVASMAYLEYFLYIRVAILWQKRLLPSYLGPSTIQLAHLFVLCATNSAILFMLTLLLARTLWSLAVNTWTIEGWEIERHHTLLRRARVLGGFLDGPDGVKVHIEHQEFPWDVGIWSNICQGMGSWNPIVWFWPFAYSPTVASGLSFEHNEIDDPSKPWPPPDPDRLYRVPRANLVGDGFTRPWDIDDFKKRQANDISRYTDADGEYVVRRRPFHKRLEAAKRTSDNAYINDDSDDIDGSDDDKQTRDYSPIKDDDGEEGWRNKEGERLADFGVDEVADFYDEDEVPLSELMRRRQNEATRSK